MTRKIKIITSQGQIKRIEPTQNTKELKEIEKIIGIRLNPKV